MKKILLAILLGLFLMPFSSCEKDDDFSIVGTWNVDKVTIRGDDTEVVSNDAGTITFESNGDGSFYLIFGQGVFSWKQISNSITITGSLLAGTYVYKNKNNNEMVLNNSILKTEYVLSRR